MKTRELVLIALLAISIVLNVWRIKTLYFNIDDAVPNYSPECISAMDIHKSYGYECKFRLDECLDLQEEVLRSWLNETPEVTILQTPENP